MLINDYRPDEALALERAEAGTLTMEDAAKFIRRLSRLRYGHRRAWDRERDRDLTARKADAFADVCHGFALLHQMLCEAEAQRESLRTRAERAERQLRCLRTPLANRLLGSPRLRAELEMASMEAPPAATVRDTVAHRVMQNEQKDQTIAQLQQELRRVKEEREALRAAARDADSRRIAIERQLWPAAPSERTSPAITTAPEAPGSEPITNVSSSESAVVEIATSDGDPPTAMRCHLSTHAVERYRERTGRNAPLHDIIAAFEKGRYAQRFCGEFSEAGWIVVCGGAFALRSKGCRSLVATTFLLRSRIAA